MVKRFRTASTRISQEAWEKYQQECLEQGITPHKDLKDYIEEKINEQGTRTVREAPATDERQTPRTDGASKEEPARRTVTINGKTYTI